MALKTIFVVGARGIGMHMVSVLLSEMVKPNVPKTSTKTAIIRPSPRGDRDTMQASSAYSIPQIAHRNTSLGLAHTARHALEVYLARRLWNKPCFEVL